ncbi:hypothetical protein FA15DRAFT_651753 [Coprinopsis marcescibilis]|uniref:Uncharacterized protein n=1 Tax=Coprinopsis marcescibilis TaxID=230819 RepID=A0A5C3LB44_COPMA|nr:hypothetical protein FA15DRAFT_651753 [Coprinopsis marcescibilis]
MPLRFWVLEDAACPSLHKISQSYLLVHYRSPLGLYTEPKIFRGAQKRGFSSWNAERLHEGTVCWRRTRGTDTRSHPNGKATTPKPVIADGGVVRLGKVTKKYIERLAQANNTSVYACKYCTLELDIDLRWSLPWMTMESEWTALGWGLGRQL